MTDLNKVILIGRVTKDIDNDERAFSYINGGTAKLLISLAVNRSVKKGDKWENYVSFFDVTVWGKQAETLKNFIHKGKQICVSGELRQDRWEKDGQKYSRIGITAESIQLLSGKEGSKENGFTKKESEADDPSYTDDPGDIPF